MFRAVISRVHRAPILVSANGTRIAVSGQRFYTDGAKPEASKEEGQEEAAAKKEGAGEPVSAEEAEKLKKAVSEKEAKIRELKDAYLRSLADAENIRNRSRTEIENTKTFAIQKFAKDLLDTVDILELALKHVPRDLVKDKEGNKSLVDLFDGVDMTRSSLLKTLARHGVDSFDPLDKPYDPNTSHALYQAPIPDKTPGHVFSVEKRGFMIKDRVLRPAQVGVVLDPKGN
ncbi:GrpE, mitochondrial [Coemansia sp. RSA 552]|nr:GrpE, mitochondrial [Coemansia sp. RSA 552]